MWRVISRRSVWLSCWESRHWRAGGKVHICGRSIPTWWPLWQKVADRQDLMTLKQSFFSVSPCPPLHRHLTTTFWFHRSSWSPFSVLACEKQIFSSDSSLVWMNYDFEIFKIPFCRKCFPLSLQLNFTVYSQIKSNYKLILICIAQNNNLQIVSWGFY